MAKAKITTFKGVAMCRLVNKHRHFAGKYSLFFRVGFFAVRKDIYICSVTFKRTEIFCRICGLECSAVSCGVMSKGPGGRGWQAKTETGMCAGLGCSGTTMKYSN